MTHRNLCKASLCQASKGNSVDFKAFGCPIRMLIGLHGLQRESTFSDETGRASHQNRGRSGVKTDVELFGVYITLIEFFWALPDFPRRQGS
jgi:hypothetical protein